MTTQESQARNDVESEAVGRHTVLLASLVLMLVMLPVFRVLPGGGIRFSILLGIVLGAAIYVNSAKRWMLVGAVLTGGGAIVGAGIAHAATSPNVQIAADFLGLALLGFTTLYLLNSLMHTQRVSRDTVVGGICVYLLIGLCFALAFILVTDLGAPKRAPSALLVRTNSIGGAENGA
jgi:hypothetical protein